MNFLSNFLRRGGVTPDAQKIINDLRLDKNAGFFHQTESARIQRAAAAKMAGLPAEQFALPYPSSNTVTNVKQGGILPMLAGAAMVAATGGLLGWQQSLFSKTPPTQPTTSVTQPPTVQSNPPPVIGIQPKPTTGQSFDADVIMEVIPPQKKP